MLFLLFVWLLFGTRNATKTMLNEQAIKHKFLVTDNNNSNSNKYDNKQL